MRASIAVAALLALTACGGGQSSVPAMPNVAAAWTIGPIVPGPLGIGGKNYSKGMPLYPSPVEGGVFAFDFPGPSGQVDGVTFFHGPLTGKQRIVMRYRIEAAPGVEFVPNEAPALAATVSLFFQRRGDDWSGDGKYASYRWYVPAEAVMPITVGEHEISVAIDQRWTSVYGLLASDTFGYAEAIADTGLIGIIFGTAYARGHGVYATGPARFVLTEFRVE